MGFGSWLRSLAGVILFVGGCVVVVMLLLLWVSYTFTGDDLVFYPRATHLAVQGTSPVPQ